MAGISECSALYEGNGYIGAINYRVKVDRNFKIPKEFQNEYIFDEDHKPKSKPISTMTDDYISKLGSFNKTKLDPAFKTSEVRKAAFSNITERDILQYDAWRNDNSKIPELLSNFDSVDDYIKFMDYYKDSHLTLDVDPAVIKSDKMKRTFSTTDKEVYKFSPKVDIEYSENDVQGLDFDRVIGSVLFSVTYVHLMHLCSKDYPAHIALNDYYEEMPEKIDALAEHYLADNAACMLCNCITPGQDPIEYLEKLKSLVSRFKPTDEVYKDSSAYQSQLDDVLNLISSTLYKLKRLATPKRTFSMPSE
jgi:hypothetical protein